MMDITPTGTARDRVTSPVIVALDNLTVEAALTLADNLDPALCRFCLLYTSPSPRD